MCNRTDLNTIGGSVNVGGDTGRDFWAVVVGSDDEDGCD